MVSISKACGAKKLPAASAGSSGSRWISRRFTLHAQGMAGQRARARLRRSPGRRRSRAAPGSPISSSAMAPASISITRSAIVVLQVEHAERRAALAGRAEGAESRTSATTCSGSAEVSTSMRVLAAGLGDQRRGSVRRLAASVRLIRQAVSVEPVNATPAMRGSVDQRAPRPPAPPGRRIKRVLGHARRVQQATPPGPRSAASAAPAWRSPHCRPPAPPRPGR